MLDHGLQVGDDLAGMREVGEAVDDRDGGVFRHFLDLGMIVGADHDRVDHAAEHARGVGDCLAAAELGGAGVEDQRRAAKLADRHVERHAGARRVLLEDHRQRATGQRRVLVRRAFG